MGAFVRGQVVVLPFPFADSDKSLSRPVLVLATVRTYNDLIVCMITKKANGVSIEITDTDFAEGQLTSPTSYVRPDRLFTADPTRIKGTVGTLRQYKMDEIMDQVCRLFDC